MLFLYTISFIIGVIIILAHSIRCYCYLVGVQLGPQGSLFLRVLCYYEFFVHYIVYYRCFNYSCTLYINYIRCYCYTLL